MVWRRRFLRRSEIRSRRSSLLRATRRLNLRLGQGLLRRSSFFPAGPRSAYPLFHNPRLALFPPTSLKFMQTGSAGTPAFGDLLACGNGVSHWGESEKIIL